MKVLQIIQKLNKPKIQAATSQLLDQVAHYKERSYRQQIEEGLKRVEHAGSPSINLGTTSWNRKIMLSVTEVFTHGLIVGATGSGKTFAALNVLLQLLNSGHSFGILDCKGELYSLAVQYLQAFIYKLPPAEREVFRKKIILIDFSSSENVSPYNLLTPLQADEVENLVHSRIETISSHFSDQDASITVRMRGILKNVLTLAALSDLPISWAERLLDDASLRARCLERCPDESVYAYFNDRFQKEPPISILALRQRLSDFLSHSSVRFALSGASAPDFRELQDQGALVLINTGVQNRSAAVLLQHLLTQDIRQSIFRRKTNTPYVWFLDEAQHLFRSRSSAEALEQILTMSRSFGSFVWLITQTLTSAVQDNDMLNLIMGNVRRIMMFRSSARDVTLIQNAIPLTGNVRKAQQHPYEMPQYLSREEEKHYRLHQITCTPDGFAYTWFKAEMQNAVLMKAARIPAPHEIAGCSKEMLKKYSAEYEMGQRVKKAEILSHLNELEKKWLSSRRTSAKPADDSNLLKILEAEYNQKQPGRKTK